MSALRSFAILFSCLLALAGCVNSAGVAEFQVYSNVFNEAQKASEEILVVLRAEERNFYRARIAAGKKVNGVAVDYDGEVPLNFDPAHAEILSDVADPPYTQAFRHSIGVLKEYNETLLKYAEGAALEPLRAQAKRLQSEAVAAATAISTAAGGGAVVLGPGAAQVLGIVDETAGLLARAGSRAAFRQELVQREPQLQALLDALIATSAEAYQLMISQTYRAIALGNSSDRKGDIAKTRARQQMIAEWVVILRNSKLALSNAVQAVQEPRTALALVSDTADLAADIRASVRRIEELSVGAE